MTCEWLVLCHGVDPNPKHGGLTLIGVIGRLAVDAVPTKSPPIAAAFRILGDPNEEFRLQIDVEGPDGAPLLGSDVLSHRLPGYGAWDSWLVFRPIPLHTIGRYKFVLKLNLRSAATVLLPVEQFVH